MKQRSKREAQHLFTGEANKIALGFNDDKRLQKKIYKAKSYAYRTSVEKVCKEELLEHTKTKELNIKDN